MKATYTDDTLTLTIDPIEQGALADLKSQGWDFTFADETEFMEPLIANSELDWIDPGETGDLTEAPLLGIVGPDTPEPILKRWGFEPYQVRSFLTDLMEKGTAQFISKW